MNILALDVRAVSTITDYIIIAEGSVDRHVSAIAQAIQMELKEKGITTLYAEGMKAGDWVVLDYLNVMVHLFVPEQREKYQLEQLYQDAKIVDLNIDVTPTVGGLYG